MAAGAQVAKGPAHAILTPEQLAELYKVECRMIDVDGRYLAVYPLAVLQEKAFAHLMLRSAARRGK